MEDNSTKTLAYLQEMARLASCPEYFFGVTFGLKNYEQQFQECKDWQS